MRPNAELWAANYDYTQSGYRYPRVLEKLSKLAVEVTYGNDENDSVLFLAGTKEGDIILKLFVGSCKDEVRDDQFDRFTLYKYDGDDSDVPGKLTESKFAEWHDGYADSGAWDEVWSGNNAEELVAKFAELCGKKPPKIEAWAATPLATRADDRNYSYTHHGFSYPSEIKKLGQVFDVSDRNDDADSILVITPEDVVFRVWVEPACEEQRSEPRERFILETYDDPDLAPPVRTPLGVEAWMNEATGQWDDVWSGNDARDLVMALEDA